MDDSLARINRSKDLLAKLAAQNGGGAGAGAGAGAGGRAPSAFSTPSAGGFGGYGQAATPSRYGGGTGGGDTDSSFGGIGNGSDGGAGGFRTGAAGAGDAYGASSGFGSRPGALSGSFMGTSVAGGGGSYGMGGMDYGMGGGAMGGGAMAGMGGATGGGALGQLSVAPMGSMGQMGQISQMGMGQMGGGMQVDRVSGGGPQGNPQLLKLAQLMGVLKPACRVESLGEQLLGTETQKRYEVRKGAKKTYVFHERVVTVNTHMGAWSMTIAKNEPVHAEVKPRRTISGNNVQLLRVHTVRVDTDFDSFRLTDHKEELRAVEDLVLTYQCASTDFVEKLTTELQECMQLDAGGRFGGIRVGMKPRCAHLLRYADRIVEKLQGGIENLSFGPRKVKKAMKHKVGPVTRYETRWIEATGGEISIYKVRCRGAERGHAEPLHRATGVSADTSTSCCCWTRTGRP